MESLRILAYAESVLSKTQICVWYKAFQDGWKAVKDAPRSGQPSNYTTYENVEKVRKIALKNWETGRLILGKKFGYATDRH